MLLVKKNKEWVLPGGEPEVNSNGSEEKFDKCIERKLKEWLPYIEFKSVGGFFCITFAASYSHKNSYKKRDGDTILDKYDLHIVSHFVNAEANDISIGKCEISDSMWADFDFNENVSDGTIKILNYLKEKLNEPKEKYLDLTECNTNHLYKIKARNSSYGIYTKDGVFILLRYKFGYMIDEELHYDYCDVFGTVKPIELIREVDERIVDAINNKNNKMLIEYFKNVYKEFEE